MKAVRHLPLLVLLFVITSCDAYTSVDGKVQGTDCQPIEGAVIEAMVDDHPYSRDESAADGTFRIECVHGKAEELLLVISKAGFRKKSIRLHPYFQYEDLLFELETDK